MGGRGGGGFGGLAAVVDSLTEFYFVPGFICQGMRFGKTIHVSPFFALLRWLIIARPKLGKVISKRFDL